MPWKDREAKNEYQRRYYREKDAEKAKRRISTRKKSLRQQYNEWKSTLSCVMCGEDDPSCLDFHHVDPNTKDVNPSDLMRDKSWSLERIKKTLTETCLCVCSNCHRKIHRRIRELNKGIPLT